MEDYKIFKDGRDIYITMGEECWRTSWIEKEFQKDTRKVEDDWGEGGRDILRGGRPRHRASKSLLPLETSLALNQLLIQPSCDAKFFPAPDKVRAENRSVRD